MMMVMVMIPQQQERAKYVIRQLEFALDQGSFGSVPTAATTTAQQASSTETETETESSSSIHAWG